MWWTRSRKPAPAPRAWPDGAELRPGLDTLRPHIADGIRRVQATLSEQPEAFTMLVFHVEFVDAFERPSIEVYFGGDPQVCDDHPLYGERLLPRRPRLLPADRAYPIRFQNLAGVDTPEACAFLDTVIDAVALVLRDEWQAHPCSALSHLEVAAGWLDLAPPASEPISGMLLDFATGERRLFELA